MTHNQLDHFSTPKHDVTRDICILACGVELTENLGSLLRLADAFGVTHVYFSATHATLSQKKVKRVSRSTVNTMKWSGDVVPVTCISTLKRQGYTIVALELTSKSLPLNLFEPDRQQKICLVVGNEKTGISDDVLKQVDLAVYIPMYGKNSSMNVAQASAISLYHLTL